MAAADTLSMIVQGLLYAVEMFRIYWIRTAGVSGFMHHTSPEPPFVTVQVSADKYNISVMQFGNFYSR